MPGETITDVTLALVRRGGAKRSGVETHGPCPISGEGKDRFWVRPGGQRGWLIGCRCELGAGGDGFKAHLAALGLGAPQPHSAPPARQTFRLSLIHISEPTRPY